MENKNNFIVDEATGKYIFAGNLSIPFDTINQNKISNESLTGIQVSLKKVISNIISSINLDKNDTITFPLSKTKDLIIDVYDKNITFVLYDIQKNCFTQSFNLDDVDLIFRKEIFIQKYTAETYDLNKTVDKDKYAKIIFNMLHNIDKNPNQFPRGRPATFMDKEIDKNIKFNYKNNRSERQDL